MLSTKKEVALSKNSSSGTQEYYYFHFGKKKKRVDYRLYHTFKEGDLVEIHLAKKSLNVVFKTILVKSGVVLNEINAPKDATKGGLR